MGRLIHSDLGDAESVSGLDHALPEPDRIFPMQVQNLLRRAFTPRGTPFFDLYVDLRRIRLGQLTPEQDLRLQLKMVMARLNQVTSPLDHLPLSPFVVGKMAEVRPVLTTLLGRVTAGTEDQNTWLRINSVFVPLLVEVARDKKVYLNVQQFGSERWATFRKMSSSQEEIEYLRDEDPESYALRQKQQTTMAAIDTRIKDTIRATGHLAGRRMYMGRPVLFSQDPATGEQRVYDRDGEVLTVQDYKVKRVEQERARKTLYRVPDRTDVPLKDIRSVPEARVDTLTGPVEWSAFTDDKAKQGRLTRVFATKKAPLFVTDSKGHTRIEHVDVISHGRYKGVYLDDMINAQGRMVEGTAYTWSSATARGHKVPRRIDPGQREPYVTLSSAKLDGVSGSRLFLKIPGTHQYRDLRQALKSLACNTGAKTGCVPTITYHAVEGSKAAAFYFDPKDFGLVADTLHGMSLSKAAMEVLKDYYEELARAELATAKEGLVRYSAEALGGFKVVKKDRVTGETSKFDLLTKQKQALAWLDTSGNRGVCALGTGIGKTLTSIGMMQKLERDGFLDEGSSYTHPDGAEVQTNGRYLYVCPANLRGNLAKEIRAFLSDPVPLLNRVDVISYREFSGSAKSGKVPRSLRKVDYWKAHDWDPGRYVAIFFDEAQELKNAASGKGEAALRLWHPRKVCLTASPLVHSPMEAYVLAAVCQNKPLFGSDPQAVANRDEQKRFKTRFCEVVGGRIMGVIQDPLIKRELDTWVKRNIFYADKRDVEEFTLPELRSDTLPVEMSPATATVYREVTRQFAKVMTAMAAKFVRREDGSLASDPAAEQMFSLTFRPLVRLLDGLANHPAETLAEVAAIKRTGTMPDGGDLPKVLQRLFANLPTDFLAGEVQDRYVNPKLDLAEQVIRTKLDNTEGASRTLLFSDDKDLCILAVKHMAEHLPGKHALALNDRIQIFQTGQEMSEIRIPIDPDLALQLLKDPAVVAEVMASTGGYSTHKLPFRSQANLRRHPELPVHVLYNPHYRKEDWQQFALKEILLPDSFIRTCTLLGQSYQYGHNLQAFDTVVHLDRDTWSNENMKQRTARAWRQGQKAPVDEYVLDAVFAPSDEGLPVSEDDPTLDEIRAAFDKMEGDIFDRILGDAQGTILGREWFRIRRKQASYAHLDRRVAELTLSPYVGRSRPTGS